METLCTALKERILDTINDQLCKLDNEDIPGKERIDLICRLLPYVIPKKSAFKDLQDDSAGGDYDPLNEIL
jgi:hypothetical protein